MSRPVRGQVPGGLRVFRGGLAGRGKTRHVAGASPLVPRLSTGRCRRADLNPAAPSDLDFQARYARRLALTLEGPLGQVHGKAMHGWLRWRHDSERPHRGVSEACRELLAHANILCTKRSPGMQGPRCGDRGHRPCGSHHEPGSDQSPAQYKPLRANRTHSLESPTTAVRRWAGGARERRGSSRRLSTRTPFCHMGPGRFPPGSSSPRESLLPCAARTGACSDLERGSWAYPGQESAAQAGVSPRMQERGPRHPRDQRWTLPLRRGSLLRTETLPGADSTMRRWQSLPMRRPW